MNPLLAAAQAYLAAGLHPIPCAVRGKRPLVPWKAFQDVAPTPKDLEFWWLSWPEANVGLVLGRGMFAVDIDSAEGRERLLAAGVELPTDAPCVTTGRGAHVYLAGDAADRVGLVPGVDVRGVGYVVAPPSIHPSGAEYRWVTPLAGGIPPAPAALLSLLGAARAAPVAAVGTDWLTTALVGVAEGGRDQTCTRIAGYFLGKGVPVEAVEVLLTAWADRCTPPFPADQVTKCVQSIAAREGAPDGPPTKIDEAVRAAVAEITAAERARPAATSFRSLDALLAGGLYPGDYVILGARPGVGKTALAIQVARLVAKQGTGVLVVSAEMTRHAIVRRMLSQESQVRATVLKTGELVEVERLLLTRGAEALSRLPIWVTSDVHTTDQLAETLSAYAPGTLGLVVVDYLQLMTTADRLRDPRQRVEAVSKDLRRLTIKHEVPLLALSSLSRPPKNVREWEPSLSDLRESGELEHDADIVWLLHRRLESEDTKLKVAKNRDGEVSTNDVHLLFQGSVLTFAEGN